MENHIQEIQTKMNFHQLQENSISLQIEEQKRQEDNFRKQLSILQDQYWSLSREKDKHNTLFLRYKNEYNALKNEDLTTEEINDVLRQLKNLSNILENANLSYMQAQICNSCDRRIMNEYKVSMKNNFEFDLSIQSTTDGETQCSLSMFYKKDSVKSILLKYLPTEICETSHGIHFGYRKTAEKLPIFKPIDI